MGDEGSHPIKHQPFNTNTGNVRCGVDCSPGWCSNISYCILCPEGTYSNRSNSTECTDCPDGFIAKSKNTTKCSSCRAGETSSPSHTLCHSCAPGTSNPRCGSPLEFLFCPSPSSFLLKTELLSLGLGDSACRVRGANFKLTSTATTVLCAFRVRAPTNPNFAFIVFFFVFQLPGMTKSDRPLASIADWDTGEWRLVLQHQILVLTVRRDIIVHNHARQSRYRVLPITIAREVLRIHHLVPFFFSPQPFPR